MVLLLCVGLQEAGKAGITPALYNMGNAFASGQGVAQDFRKAFMAYEGNHFLAFLHFHSLRLEFSHVDSVAVKIVC